MAHYDQLGLGGELTPPFLLGAGSSDCRLKGLTNAGSSLKASLPPALHATCSSMHVIAVPRHTMPRPRRSLARLLQSVSHVLTHVLTPKTRMGSKGCSPISSPTRLRENCRGCSTITFLDIEVWAGLLRATARLMRFACVLQKTCPKFDVQKCCCRKVTAELVVGT